ncbi:MAG: DUF1449 family protein [Phycisphaerae bacterium]|nr:DUF1449 family protein [Phycisphaerae bacterium]
MWTELLASSAGDLLMGANLPFVASFLLAVLFTLLSVLGLGHSDADADVDADADLDHDIDLDHDVDVDLEHDLDLEVDHDVDLEVDHDIDMDADHDLDVDHDVETEIAHDHDVEHDAEVHAGHEAGVDTVSAITLNDVLYFFGIGKVPLSILLMTACYTFGLVGWLLNTSAARPGGEVGAWFTVSLLGALTASLVMMRLVSSVIARYLPTKGVSGFTRRQLVGMRGVVGLPVDEQGGRAQFTDPEGTLHQIRCRVVPGGKPLPKGAKIIVVKYLLKDDLYYVAADRRR